MTASDHKRKSRPIAAATVTVDSSAITIVVPDVLGKNESHVSGHGGARHTSAATKRYRESVRVGVITWRAARDLAAIADAPLGLQHGQAMEGAWRLEVLAVWPRQRNTIAGRPVDFGTCPMGDADAAIPQALDALQHAGVLDDDARVVEVKAWSMYRKDQRATIVRLVRVPERAQHVVEACGHLLRLVPAMPEDRTIKVYPKATAAQRKAWKVGDRCQVFGEGDAVFEVVEAPCDKFPNSAYLGHVTGGSVVDHGRESLHKMTRVAKGGRARRKTG